MNARADTIRVATLDDLPKWLYLAKERYPDRDIGATARWVSWCITHPARLVLVGHGCAGIAGVDLHYGIELRGKMNVLYSIPCLEPGIEAMTMLKKMVAWAKEKGAVPPFLIDNDSGVDFGPFVKRLGGQRDEAPRYTIPF